MKNKKIVLGVTGCIAAYKTCQLVRDFIKLGAEVRIVMSPSASEFVSPLTLSTLSKNPVIQTIFPSSQKADVSHSPWHIEYALWADVMVIAPTSVNTVAKIANGFTDNALTVLACAMRAPIIISPVADVDMYENRATQENLDKLRNRGITIIDAESGELASGLVGRGRLPELNKIVDYTKSVLNGYKQDLTGEKILVTAGPTFEDIDPVRFLGNRSSGKMGFEIAKAAFLRGADVTLISGPTSQAIYEGIKVVRVRSAAEMKISVETELKNNDTLIMAAAVADFKPAKFSEIKIKKSEEERVLELSKTDDILQSIDKTGKRIIGFALETNNIEENAIKKLTGKGLDFIVLNKPSAEGTGFEYDTNAVTIIDSDLTHTELPLSSKFDIANGILSHLTKLR